MSVLRVYDEVECGRDGYPLAWHRGDPAIKDLVRELAGHRCVRCLHPYRCGKSPGEWSPCDERCDHDGDPGRLVEFPGRDACLLGDEPGVMMSWPEAGQTGPRTREHHEFARQIVADHPGLRRIEARWRVLTVHHLTGAKCNCRWWNLAALCQRCHLRIQGRVRMEQVYPHEHSEWFKPYAAGYYAATYLGQDLDRAETEERLDELLALEHARDFSGEAVA